MEARLTKHRRPINRATDFVLQSMEARRMLSATLEDGVWTIEADNDKNHTITVDIHPTNSAKLRAVIDGKVVGTALRDEIDWVEIYGGEGDDKITFDVNDPDFSVDVYAGGGDDTIIGGPGDDELNGEDGNDSIIGG